METTAWQELLQAIWRKQFPESALSPALAGPTNVNLYWDLLIEALGHLFQKLHAVRTLTLPGTHSTATFLKYNKFLSDAAFV